MLHRRAGMEMEGPALGIVAAIFGRVDAQPLGRDVDLVLVEHEADVAAHHQRRHHQERAEHADPHRQHD